MSYNSLKVLIPKKSPAHIEIEKFRKTRRISELVFLGALASFAGGAAIAGGTVMKDNQSGALKLGLSMIGVSFGMAFGAEFALFNNKYKLKKSISIYNGMMKPSYR